MQTFLPYPDFAQSAACMDRQRLGKQRVEVMTILDTLQGRSAGWVHHPAVRMWQGFEPSLALYGVVVCNEWMARGYRDRCRDWIEEMFPEAFWRMPSKDVESPPWLGNPNFHAAHRSNLLRKDPVWYGQFGWTEPNDLPYLWPNKETL